jgi:hexosaminidase
MYRMRPSPRLFEGRLMSCEAPVHLIPVPQNLTRLDGYYRLSSATLTLSAEEPWQPVLQLLTPDLAKLGVVVVAEEYRDATACIRLAADRSLENEAYRLRVDHAGVQIEAATQAGMVYGIQTLRQILAQVEQTDGVLLLPQIEIQDAPLFPYRGMHLDVSRHFFDVTFVKRYIDLLALHKLNFFHWHLTDDNGWRVEIKALPQLTAVGAFRSGTVVGFTRDVGTVSDGIPHGGFYSQEEVRDIVAYAAERAITIIPEIDLPGHASALLAAYPEIGCGNRSYEVKTHFGIYEDVLCPKEATFQLLERVFAEVADLFPGPYIHLGGDEVKTARWEACTDCQDLMRQQSFTRVSDLQTYFVARVVAMIKAVGKKPMAWDDVVDEQLDPDVAVMSWYYPEKARKALINGNGIVMTPVDHAYFDFYQSHCVDEPMAPWWLTRLSDVYRFDPLENFADLEQRSSVLGGQANLWTEYVPTPEIAERMVLPRMSALAEVLWSPKRLQDWQSFCHRLPSLEQWLNQLGYIVADSQYKPHVWAERGEAGGFRVFLETAVDSMVYTLDGSPPTLQSARYDGPLSILGSTTVRAATVRPDGTLLGDARLTLVDHLGIGQDICFKHLSDEMAKQASAKLLSGQLAHDRVYDRPYWTEFHGVDLDATMTFQTATLISSVRIGIDAGLHRRLQRPDGISLSVRRLDEPWQEIAVIDRGQIEAADREVIIQFEPLEVTQLRLVALNRELIWMVEGQRMAPKSIYIDEIVVQ